MPGHAQQLFECGQERPVDHDQQRSKQGSVPWKWKKGTAAAGQADFGDPVGGNPTYALCLYDYTGGSPALVMGLNVAPGGTCGAAPCWKAISDKGWAYQNVIGNSQGITKVKFTGGSPGQPSLQVRGKGASLPLPAPVGQSEFFTQDPLITLQLHSSTSPTCWSSSFGPSGTKKNDAAHFKATAP